MIFIYISSNCKQHKLFICFILGTIIKTPEIFVFFDISKMPFCLNGTNLTVTNSSLSEYSYVIFLVVLPTIH